MRLLIVKILMNTTEQHIDIALGDPLLDAEHAEILRLTDQLEAACGPDDIVPALDALIEHCVEHFAAEDADLRKISRVEDDDAHCHIKEHGAVLASLREVRDYVAKGAEPVNVAGNLLALCRELRRWLPEHVKFMDGAVAHYRTRERFGGAPILISKPAKR